jgi:8-oxo-dGTP diphosphatase
VSSELNARPTKTVFAAGGIVAKTIDDQTKIVVIHRPRGDWTLPKGKRDEGETLEQTALREVKEETGLDAQIGAFASTLAYPIGERHKLVFYWHMIPTGGEFKATKEVDELAWLTPEEAIDSLTYAYERELVAREFLVAPRMAIAQRSSTLTDPVAPVARVVLRAQTATLLVILSVSLTLFLSISAMAHIPLGAQDGGIDAFVLIAASLLGMAGASLSALISFARARNDDEIPEHLRGPPITALRPFVGAAAALVASLLIHANLINLGQESAAKLFVAAFAAGFSERWLLGIRRPRRGGRGDAGEE